MVNSGESYIADNMPQNIPPRKTRGRPKGRKATVLKSKIKKSPENIQAKYRELIKRQQRELKEEKRELKKKEEKIKKGSVLPDKWIEFAKNYAVNMDKKEAAISAGFPEESAITAANILLTKTAVWEIIKKIQVELMYASNINTQKLLDQLWAEATRTGEGTSHSARVAALSALAKIGGLHLPSDIAYKQAAADIEIAADKQKAIKEGDKQVANMLVIVGA